MVEKPFSPGFLAYPPTPALVKAGAAPGTTAGVELLLLCFPRSNPSRSQQAPQCHINGFLWASKRAVCQPNGFLWASKRAVCQPLNWPRLACRLPALKLTPLLLGGPAYRSPGVTRFKPIGQLTGTEGHINGFFRDAVSQAANSAAPRPHRLNILLACFILQPPGTPRPHINSFLWASSP